VTNAKQRLAASVLAVLAIASLVPTVAAQQEFRPPAGPAPRTAAGKIDFSGVWQRPYVPDMTKDGKDQKGTPELPFTPWGEANWKAYDAAEGDYTGACLPFGMTRSVNTPEPIQIVQNDKYFTFLFEINSWFTVATASRPGLATRSLIGKATRWSSTPSTSTARRASIRSATRTAISCISSSASRVRISVTSRTKWSSTTRRPSRSPGRTRAPSPSGPTGK
jgi:hypothetical protein